MRVYTASRITGTCKKLAKIQKPNFVMVIAVKFIVEQVIKKATSVFELDHLAINYICTLLCTVSRYN